MRPLQGRFSLASGLTGRLIGVVGAGRSGKAAAVLAARAGALVLLSDSGPCPAVKERISLPGIESEYGGHSRRLLECDLIVKSPGVHRELTILAAARRAGIPVLSELGFALRFARPGRIVAVTGTNGKTTVTTLIGRVLAAGGIPVKVCGNIGTPLSEIALSVRPRDTIVLELSSYQLEDTPDFRPDIGIILNITPDHVEHHRTMRRYRASKAVMFMNQRPRDLCILNADDPALRPFARRVPGRTAFFSVRRAVCPGIYARDSRAHLCLKGPAVSFELRPRIPGRHNRENILAASGAAAACGVPVRVIERVVNSFPGVEHRIELCGTINGAPCYNDSKATNVDSTRVALESMDRPVWLILGGRDKGAPYAPLIPLIQEKTRGILLIGEAAPIIRRELRGTVRLYECATMAGAVGRARLLAGHDDAVLLSPACASFDQYRNYEERGRHFKTLVRGGAHRP